MPAGIHVGLPPLPHGPAGAWSALSHCKQKLQIAVKILILQTMKIKVFIGFEF
jgi:hypothetical protein